MTADELIKYLEDWAPPGIAWERDNVGLQVGFSKQKLKNILLSLELNEKVLNEALKKNCNFIFTHHPFIFNPIKRIDASTNSKSKIINALLKNNISVYSAHTNLDYTQDGVSFALANKLKLKKIDFLENEIASQFKVSVFIPEPYVDRFSEELFKAGAGRIGNYDNCSFMSGGIGTFKGNKNSNPSLGLPNKFEKVPEIKIEYVFNQWSLSNIVSAIKKHHPYEEPAFDIYPIKNKNSNYGSGALGELEKPLSTNDFIKYVAQQLGADGLKFCSGTNKKIAKVAVCGGSGSELVSKALLKSADAFITADIKYHTFQDYEGKILLIDAGHYETEIHSMKNVKKKLESYIKNEDNIKVFTFTGSTNPVKFYKH